MISAFLYQLISAMYPHIGAAADNNSFGG